MRDITPFFYLILILGRACSLLPALYIQPALREQVSCLLSQNLLSASNFSNYSSSYSFSAFSASLLLVLVLVLVQLGILLSLPFLLDIFLGIYINRARDTKLVRHIKKNCPKQRSESSYLRCILCSECSFSR
jgi:hypothetical protein